MENINLSSKKKWVKVKLGDLASTITKGSTPTTYGFNYLDKGIPFIKIENIENDKISHRSIKQFISNEAHEYQSRSQLQEGDILFSIAGTIGKTCIVTKNDIPSNTNQALSIIRGTKKYLLPKFLKLQFLSILSTTVKKKARGGAMSNISLNDLEKMDILLPSIQEQNRIIEKIEELFSDLDKATEELKKTQEQLKIYRQAVLKDAFEGKLTEEWRRNNNTSSADLLFRKVFNKRKEIYRKQQFKKCKKLKPPEKFYKKENITEIKLDGIPDTWKQIKFIDLIKYEENTIKRGPFGSAIKKVYFVLKGYKVYEQKNAINDDVMLGNYFIDEAKYKELERFSVKGGDYIISCSGTIGRISKLPKDASIGVINQALLKIVLDEDLFIDRLFLYLFRAEFFQRKILKETRGSAMKNISSVEDIKNINVLLPSKKEQEQMLQEIESRLSVCDKLEETVQQSLEKIKYLRQSILKKAFEGNLVPQNPEDEPAEKLLERIKQEKEKHKYNNKKRKKR